MLFEVKKVRKICFFLRYLLFYSEVLPMYLSLSIVSLPRSKVREVVRTEIGEMIFPPTIASLDKARN